MDVNKGRKAKIRFFEVFNFFDFLQLKFSDFQLKKNQTKIGKNKKSQKNQENLT